MSHQNAIPMLIMQPDPRVLTEEIYDTGEPILPKKEGEFTFLAMQPIYTKDSQPFKSSQFPSEPTQWDTSQFQPGATAVGPCVVLWTRVVRTNGTLLQKKTPDLIV